MKKTILVLALVVLAVSCVFAGTHSVKGGMTAYGFQRFSSSDKSVNSVNNRYGLGGSLGYEYDINDKLFAGLDVKYVSNWMKEKENLTDISALLRAGYRFAVNEKFDAYAAAEGGINYQCFEEDHAILVPFGIVGGARYTFAEKFKAFAELENLYQLSKIDEVNYLNIKLNVNLGVEYQF